MTYEEEVVVMNRAIKTYGVNAQIEQLMEESIELALACKKYLRHKGSPEKLQELKGEIADVGIMIDQFFQIFPESEQEVFGIMEEKFSRLKDRLDEYDASNGGNG